ncbi:MAG: hypothetical protein IKG32_08095 [Clostridia bacterium]|nr:hypothetical protein [Clostridia bacterium]
MDREDSQQKPVSTSACAYCGGTLRSDQKFCTNCGASNPNYVEDTPRRIFHPKTIAELKEYCAERGMPLLRMRFFIGEDYREPRAFGIYQDGDRFVVYKNKDNGNRAVRYDGPDEAYAVNELFQKLLSECHNRGIYPDGRPTPSASRSDPQSQMSNGQALRKGCGLLILITLIISVLAGGVLALFLGIGNYRRHKDDGYYRYEDQSLYYRSGSSVYCLSETDDWWVPVTYLPYDEATLFIKKKEAANRSDIVPFIQERAGYPSTGYYRLPDGSFYYFYGSIWFAYGGEEEGWKELYGLPQCPAGFKQDGAFLGWDHDPAWNMPDVDDDFYIATMKDWHSRDGYYRFGDDIYYYFGEHYDRAENWYAYGEKGWQSTEAPEGDYKAYNAAFLSAEHDPAWGVPKAEDSFAVATQSDWHSKDGYYWFGDQLFYYYGQSYDSDNNWYGYDDGDWVKTDAPEGSYDTAYEGENWDSDWGTESFTDSDTWDDLHPSYSSSDSGSSYDSWDSGSSYDSWDSGSTDWSSDW